jgi:hypothetical protein
MQTRRHFLRQFALTSAAASLLPRGFALDAIAPAPQPDAVTFFLVGDTHYCADDKDPTQMDPTSAGYNHRLVDWLNRLPGTPFSAEVGGGNVPQPKGVVHAGDLVHNGNSFATKPKLAETELAAFTADWGLNGGDAKLRWPVREVHGNHDAPQGTGPIYEALLERTKKRADLANVSENGLHYSWDWGGVHFVALGIVVGDAPEIHRARRYAPRGSLPFLQQDLEKNVGQSGRPVILVNHVDVLRYSTAVAEDKVLKNEWDYGDTAAFYSVIKPYRIAATMCGHTHARKIARWDGTGLASATAGVPFLNTDNAGHFSSETQAFLQIEITPRELRVREFATPDGWETAAWTPQVWRFPLG